jgi:hypothetical protein
VVMASPMAVAPFGDAARRLDCRTVRFIPRGTKKVDAAQTIEAAPLLRLRGSNAFARTWISGVRRSQQWFSLSKAAPLSRFAIAMNSWPTVIKRRRDQRYDLRRKASRRWQSLASEASSLFFCHFDLNGEWVFDRGAATVQQFPLAATRLPPRRVQAA